MWPLPALAMADRTFHSEYSASQESTAGEALNHANPRSESPRLDLTGNIKAPRALSTRNNPFDELDTNIHPQEKFRYDKGRLRLPTALVPSTERWTDLLHKGGRATSSRGSRLRKRPFAPSKKPTRITPPRLVSVYVWHNTVSLLL